MKNIKKAVMKTACEILGRRKVSFRKDLRRIGLESLSFTELVAETEESFGIELSGDRIAYFRNLNEFSVYVGSKVSHDDKRYC